MVKFKNLVIDLAIATAVAIALGWSATPQPRPSSTVKQGAVGSLSSVTQAPTSGILKDAKDSLL